MSRGATGLGSLPVRASPFACRSHARLESKMQTMGRAG
jgi:hypothetical protein